MLLYPLAHIWSNMYVLLFHFDVSLTRLEGLTAYILTDDIVVLCKSVCMKRRGVMKFVFVSGNDANFD